MNVSPTETMAAIRNRVARRTEMIGVLLAAVFGAAATTGSRFLRQATTFGVAKANVIRVSAAPHRKTIQRGAMAGVVAAAVIGIVVGTASTSSATPTPTAAKTTQSQIVDKATGSSAPHSSAKAAAKAPARAAHAAHAAVPSKKRLLPHGVSAGQASFKLSSGQRANAAAIVKAGQDMHLSPRAMVLAVACAMQESHLNNYGNLGASNDHDSQGLFQQRPSSGWGSPAQVTNPHHAAQSFLKRLIQIPGWQRMSATHAIQAVQVSAFPEAYAKWEKFAANVVASTYAQNAASHAAQAAHAAHK